MMDFSENMRQTNPATPARKAEPVTGCPPLRCLVAPNPSALTGAGTNSYIVGSGAVAVIDPGPDHAGHLAAILSALRPGERVAQIVVTHAHLDHSALAPRLAAVTGAPVAAFGTATDGRSAAMAALAAAGYPDGGEGLDRAFRPDQCLRDGDVLSGPDWTLDVLHMPGHLGGHLCLATGGGVLFSGDHVMGWSTSVVAPPDGDMGDYMASLARLARGAWTRLLPGHGAPVDDPAARLAELIRHREDRAGQILSALRDAPADAATLARRVYHGLAPALLPAATANVMAHLVDFTAKGLAQTTSPLRPASRFTAL